MRTVIAFLPSSKVPSVRVISTSPEARGVKPPASRSTSTSRVRPRRGLRPGRVHLAHHRHELALVLLDLDLHLRVHQVVAREQGGELALDLGDREAGHLHLAQQRQGDRAVRLHGGGAREVVVAEDRDLEHVAGPDLGSLREAAAGSRVGAGAVVDGIGRSVSELASARPGAASRRRAPRSLPPGPGAEQA